MSLAIREEDAEPFRVLALTGRLDTDTSADLELALMDLLQAGQTRFVIDLAGVGYVSSAGLRVLLMLGKKVDGSGELKLAALNPSVKQVFDVAGFTQLFSIYRDRATALGSEPKKPVNAGLGPAVSRMLGADEEPGAVRVDPEHASRVARALGVKGKS
ncbi:MAG: STAS domain-containing protein [Dokdonella sp.]